MTEQPQAILVSNNLVLNGKRIVSGPVEECYCKNGECVTAAPPTILETKAEALEEWAAWLETNKKAADWRAVRKYAAAIREGRTYP